MRLLQLTSSNPKFKTINFEQGLNIVVGTQLTEEQKKSINGIGKSMSLSLIHYILGAKFKTNTEKKLEKYLSEYGDFTLKFTHKNINYVITKNFKLPEYHINGEKINKANYPKKLNEIFLGDESAKPTFRQIFNSFARRHSSDVSYYSNILTQQGMGIEDYYQRLTNLFLLGVDLSLVEKNFDNKNKLVKLDKAKKTIEEYKKALDNSNLNDIKDEIKRLEKELNDFIIAENYDKLKQDADSLTNQLNEYRNKIFFNEENLRRKEKTFDSSKDINIDVRKIEAVFNEANFFFEDKITKTLEQSKEFHTNLIKNRKRRLATEINDLKILIERLNIEKEKVSKKRDLLLKDLNNKGALEERDSLKDRIKTLENEQKDLEKYEHILSDFKKDKTNLELENAIIKKESISYLENNQKVIDAIEGKFRELVKCFYDNKGGSLKIDEAPTAKYLFNINSHIPREGSQGVGEVKIFCYDVLLYLLNKKLLSFLAHDGCIFSEMDYRQKSKIFKVVLELSKDNEFQYFVNIGDSSLQEVLDKDILTEKEKETIKKSIRIELSDKSPENWLFGESFD
jgi:uncharacterized protein YydD (DUF2326 family)